MSIETPVLTLPTKSAQQNVEKIQCAMGDFIKENDSTLCVVICNNSAPRSDDNPFMMSFSRDPEASLGPDEIFDLGMLAMLCGDTLGAYIPLISIQDSVSTQFHKQKRQDPGIAAIQSLIALFMDQAILKTNMINLDVFRIEGGALRGLITLIGIYYRKVKHLGVLASYSITKSGGQNVLHVTTEMIRPLT